MNTNYIRLMNILKNEELINDNDINTKLFSIYNILNNNYEYNNLNYDIKNLIFDLNKDYNLFLKIISNYKDNYNFNNVNINDIKINNLLDENDIVLIENKELKKIFKTILLNYINKYYKLDNINDEIYFYKYIFNFIIKKLNLTIDDLNNLNFNINDINNIFNNIDFKLLFDFLNKINYISYYYPWAYLYHIDIEIFINNINDLNDILISL